MLILNIINYVKIQVIMMQDNLMLLIIKAFSSFKFTFIISLFYMKLYKLSIEFATKTKKKSENISNSKIDKEDGNGDSSYLHLFRSRYVKCIHHICCGFTYHCYFLKNMSSVSFYHSIE